jgi:anti-anti-sigma factor
MIVETNWQGDVAIAHLIGELDTTESEGVWGELRQILGEEPAACVIDMSHTNYIASLGLSILLKFAQEMRFRQIHLRLAAVQPRIRIVLDTANLGRILPIDPTVADALQAIEKRGPLPAPYKPKKPAYLPD